MNSSDYRAFNMINTIHFDFHFIVTFRDGDDDQTHKRRQLMYAIPISDSVVLVVLWARLPFIQMIRNSIKNLYLANIKRSEMTLNKDTHVVFDKDRKKTMF